jgi:type VI secretion system secreted protein VgrG
MHAVITAPAGVGNYASVDAQGRYKVKFPFAEAVYDAGNNAMTEDDGLSVPIRMMQVNAGATSGVHFPLLKDAEVLVGFTEGDPDRPFILGAAPNPNNPSVVKDTNNKENIIQTKPGHSLVINDEDGRKQLTLSSAEGHCLTMLDDATKREVRLTSANTNNFIRIIEKA